VSAEPIVFNGVVRNITFENDQTGYRVLRVEVPGQGMEIVVGTCPRVAPTMEVRVVGKRVNDQRYGAQVQAESITVVTPTTRLGIERFLASGLVRGLGSRLSARIVSHFGDETLKVLDEGGERLSEVKGVSKSLARGAAEAWASQKSQTSVLVFLHSHGITPGLAGRIFRRYGARASEVVLESPFRLAMEVPGVGFVTADRIAQSVGIAKDAPERMEAGVVHWVHQVTEAGHVYVPRGELVERASRELSTEAAPVEEALDRVAASRRVAVDGDAGPDQRVFPAHLYEAEVSLARMFTALLRERGKPLLQTGKAIETFERTTGITLAQAQREAVEAAAHNKVLIITGGPGVGKTTLVRAVLALFELSKLETRLCAPTGRAAKRLSESTSRPALTVHRLLEVDPRSGRFLRRQEHRLEGEAFVVDEASMLDVLLARSLLDAIDPSARLILVGDVDQLPSVGAGALLRDAISSGAVPVVRLTTIFRQAAQSLIVASAHRIREGEPPISAEGRKGDFFIIPRTDPQRARATVLELVEKRIPAGFGLDPRRDVQVLTPMRKGEVGVEALNDELQRVLNPEGGAQVVRGGKTLRVGDKVMQLKNDYKRDVYNGDIGFVHSIEPGTRRVVVRIDEDREVEYDEDALENLSLAYAASIHKSQGSEYPAVVIPWLRQHYVMLSRNLLYTAVTRGKQLVILVADPRAIAVALGDDRREERRTTLGERLERALADAR
jgi:exodeoxyribonuclease V alpha subunit